MIKSDIWIEDQCRRNKLISPYQIEQMSKNIISFGMSSAGYDIRISDKYKIFTNLNSTIIDPKNFDIKNFIEFTGPYCIIPPNSFVLAESVEHFKIPRNILAICLGKSTYARCGIIVNTTPLEPEWQGILTIEISNTTPLPAKIYSNEGIAQVIFLESNETCRTSYADRKGKYQNQEGIVLPKV